MKYLSPRSDIGFKKLFGDANHKDLTISFLNSILNLFGDQVIDTVDFEETEQLPESQDGSDFAHFMPHIQTLKKNSKLWQRYDGR